MLVSKTRHRRASEAVQIAGSAKYPASNSNSDGASLSAFNRFALTFSPTSGPLATNHVPGKVATPVTPVATAAEPPAKPIAAPIPAARAGAARPPAETLKS